MKRKKYLQYFCIIHTLLYLCCVDALRFLIELFTLGHSKIRAFVTHGGLGSCQEAVYHGVPMVIIPLFADQDWNARRAAEDRTAVVLDFLEITSESLLDALNTVINDSRYVQ